MAVFPPPESATELPCPACPTAPAPSSRGPCWVHTPPLRVNTHAAPALVLSPKPPRIAVLPSPDSATEPPCWVCPTPPLPTSLASCWVHAPPLRVNTHD